MRRKRLAGLSGFLVLAFLATPAISASAATPSADLATTVRASFPVFYNGSGGGFTITVTNNGPSEAQAVVVSDTFYSSFSTFRHVTATAPSGASCVAPPVGSRGAVTCTTASLPPGASMTIGLVLHALGIPKQVVADRATATSTTFDPNTANNTATASASLI